LVTQEGKSIAQTALSLKIHPNLLRGWKIALEEENNSQQPAFPGNGNRPPHEAAIHRLKAEIRRLEIEREILKKSRHCSPRN
jgi:transposase